MTRPELPAEAAGDDPTEWKWDGQRWTAAPHTHRDGTRRWDGERWVRWPPGSPTVAAGTVPPAPMPLVGEVG